MVLVSLGWQSIYEKENSNTKPTGPPGLGVGRWANNPVPEKNRPVIETATTNPGNNLAPEESSPVEPMTQAGESPREASA